MTEMQMAGGLAALRRMTSQRPAVERCELCGAVLGPEHPHLLEREKRRIACACQACGVLFSGQEGGRFRRIPRRVRPLTDFAFTDVEWEELMLPIGLAFFIRSDDGRIEALYPGAAGVVESLISLDGSSYRFTEHPVLAGMEPEVEALLVNRVGREPVYVVVPVDECFRLAGAIRKSWRGISGGPAVWSTVSRFFDELRAKAEGRERLRYA